MAYDPKYILLSSRTTSEKRKMTVTNGENLFSFQAFYSSQRQVRQSKFNVFVNEENLLQLYSLQSKAFEVQSGFTV